MAERNVQLEAYQKIWEVLEGYAPFAADVPPGNRIKFDLNTGLFDPMKQNTADGDFHEAVLWPKSGSDDLHTTETTFGSFDGDGANCGANTEFELVYRLTITSPFMGINQISLTGTRALTALRKAGRTLGLDFAKGVTVTYETNRDVRDETVRWTHDVDIWIQGEALVADLM